MNEIELAWAAGFWDGEGSVSLSYRGVYNRPRIIVEIAQVHREVLDRFTAATGMGKVRGPYRPKTKNAQPYYRWGLEGTTHLHLLKNKIYTYLGSEKRNQIDRAIDAQRLWEKTALCPLGHRLEKSPKGKWMCLICLKEQGKKNAATRWGG
jgi:hypothetical protein